MSIIKINDLVNMIACKVAFRILSLHQVRCSNKKYTSFPFFRLFAPTNHYTRLHRSVEEQIFTNADYALNQICFDQITPHLKLINSIENAVW